MVVPALAAACAACSQARASAADAAALTHGGDPDRGKALVERYGCGACHHVPGIPGARGRVGPPLDGIGTRLFVAGVKMNHPDDLIAWIQDPPAADSSTAMPSLGLSEHDARDIAAYLYTLK